MSIAVALEEIRTKAMRLNQYLCDNADDLDACREQYAEAGIHHDIRWLSPQMEDAIRETGMDIPAITDEWSTETLTMATAYIEGVLLGLNFARLGYAAAGAAPSLDEEWQWFADTVRAKQKSCADEISNGKPPMAAMDGMVDWMIDQFDKSLAAAGAAPSLDELLDSVGVEPYIATNAGDCGVVNKGGRYYARLYANGIAVSGEGKTFTAAIADAVAAARAQQKEGNQ